MNLALGELSSKRLDDEKQETRAPHLTQGVQRCPKMESKPRDCRREEADSSGVVFPPTGLHHLAKGWLVVIREESVSGPLVIDAKQNVQSVSASNEHNVAAQDSLALSGL